MPRKKTEVDRRLDALAKKAPDRTLSTKELVALHLSKIAELRVKRHSWERIGEAIGVKPNTLRQYFGREQSPKASAPKSKADPVEVRGNPAQPTLLRRQREDEEI